MTTLSSTLKEDVRKDPQSLEREADRARADVESTLEALERRLSPNELFDHAMHSIKQNGGDFGRNLMTQLRNNPVPSVLAGIGLTWLMAASKTPPRPTESSSTGETLGDKAASAAASTRAAADRARSAVGGAADTARSAIHGAADSARGAIHGAAGTARGAVHGTAEGVAGATRQIRDRYDAMSREQPLVLGALAVAAGVAIGALLPTTDSENEWIGRASDDAKDRLRDEATRKWQDTKVAAAGAADAAERAAKSELTGDGESRRQEPRRSEPDDGRAAEPSPSPSRREAEPPGGLGRGSGQRR